MNTDPTMGQADANALRAAADVLRAGGTLPENTRALLSDLLRAEAAMFETMQPLVELVSAVITQESGGQASIRIMRDDVGNVRLLNDNTSNALRVASAVLNANPSEADQ